jgi:ribosomal protein S3AE
MNFIKVDLCILITIRKWLTKIIQQEANDYSLTMVHLNNISKKSNTEITIYTKKVAVLSLIHL